MRPSMAVMARELVARKELVLLAMAAAVIVSLMPYLPGLEGYSPNDVRSVSSSAVALALGCCLAILLGATVFGGDLSAGRISFYFARPLSSFAVWWGRCAAAVLLIWAVEAIVVVPAVLSTGIDVFVSSDGGIWFLVAAFVLAPCLLFFLAHAVSIMARARTSWLFLDLAGVVVFGVLSWLILRPLVEIGAMLTSLVVAGALIFALLAALAVGGWSGVAVGRVDLPKNHSAMSLALWSTFAVGMAAITVYSSWLRDFGPREFGDVEVMTIAPDGAWTEVVGQADRRLDVRRRYLVSTQANRWLPLPPRRRSDNADVVFSEDGAVAVWRGGGVADEPRSLWWADLGRPDPMARSTSFMVAEDAALTPSNDGSRLAILEQGTLSVYDLEDERLLRAIRLPQDSQRVVLVFATADTLRLFARVESGGVTAIRISEIDVASGELTLTGEIDGLGGNTWFAADVDLRHLFVYSRSDNELAPTRRLFDGLTGAWIRNVNVGGFPLFLADGRMVFAEENSDGSVTLVVERVEGGDRVVHQLGAAEALRVNGEAVPGWVVVSRLASAADRSQGLRVDLVNVDTGQARRIGSHLRRTFPWLPWQSGVEMGFFWHRLRPEASRLFIEHSGALVRWDSESGKLVRVVGGQPTSP